MEQFAFYLVALLSVMTALGVVAFRQPIYSAFSLIVNMLLMAVLFAMLQAHFLAAVQVIVYAGAIMVLVVFVIMLLSIRSQERRPIGTFMGIIVGFTSITFLMIVVPHLTTEIVAPDALVSSPAVGDVRSIGLLLYTKYLLPFEFSSMLLMAAVVGAVMLARRRYLGPQDITGEAL